MRKLVLVGLVAAAVLGLLASSTTAASNETGVTARGITIGGTHPLTGGASLYATIQGAMKAYFAYVNARRGTDGKRGVYGRQINYIVYDDGYNPANTVQLTRKLVEQDKVFAVVGSLGTEHGEAIRSYMNQRKVPQILNATGATTWSESKKYPWTGGWQPDYEFEGLTYGQKIARNSPNAKIAVLYQNDSFGADNVRGLERGLGDKKSNIVGKESYEPTAADVRSQMAKLRATGANILVLIGTPRFVIGSYAIATALRWTPDVVYTTSVSATDAFLTAAKAAGASTAILNNTFTRQYTKDPANPAWDNDATMKLYKSVMAKYYPSGRATDGLNFYGMAVAHAFTQLLYKAGPSLTRAKLMAAYRSWNEVNPFLLPGIKQKTGVNDARPVDCSRLVRYRDGVFVPVSAIKCYNGSTTS